MKYDTSNHKVSIEEICDTIIEDAQNIFLNQSDYTKAITLELSEYTGLYTDDELTREINEEIKNNLTSQEIRIYEDVCDENDLIISSKEQFSAIYASVTLLSDDKNKSKISLSFGSAMIDLLT